MNRFQYNRIQEVLEENNKDIYWLHSQLNDETIPVVTRWCKNVKQPTIEQLFEIARILQIDVRELLVSSSSTSTEIIEEFQGKNNVRHIVSASGNMSWLTPEISFADETNAKGACKLNTVENETRHVLFLFNNKDEEVGRYYIGKKLQGMSPAQLVEIKESLVFFESWNPEKKSWVPCVGVSSNDKVISNMGIYKEGFGLFTVFKDGYYSVVDKNGNIIVPAGKYGYIDIFDKCGLARVKINGFTSFSNPKESTTDKWGIIDMFGNEVLPVKYDEVWKFYDKNRKTTRVMNTELEMVNGNYPVMHKKGYDFYLETHYLHELGYYIDGEFYKHPYVDDDKDYSVWDALEDEPEAAGNIDYEGPY